MAYSPVTFNAINVELFCEITHAIENDPKYFIPLIYEKETADMQAHILDKFYTYRRIELFAAMLDVDTLKTLNIYITARYNEKIKKQIVIRSDYNY